MDQNEALPGHLTSSDHDETSPKPNKYICKYQECLKVFKAKKSLNDHTRIHKGEKPFKCSFDPCDKAFTQFSSLQKHERIHKGEKPYVCSVCGKAFTQISNLKRHERSHRGERPHPCEVCSKEFTTSSNLKQHLQTHLQKESRDKFGCNSCGKTYSYNSSLKKHLQEHNAEHTSTESPSENQTTPLQISGDLRGREVMEKLTGFPQLSKIPEPTKFSVNQNMHSFYEFAYNPLSIPQNNFEMFHDFQRNLMLPGLLQGSAFGRGNNDISSLKRAVDMSKMTHGRIDNKVCRRAYKNHFHIHSLVCEHIMILHQGHLDYLHDGKLHHVSSDGCLEEHELEISDQNPITCRPVNSAGCAQRNSCANSTHLSKLNMPANSHNAKFTSEKNCANSSCCNPVKELPALLLSNNQSTTGDLQIIVKEESVPPKHVHGESCDHPMIIHDGHIDFIVEGKLHHVHDDHYDDHGSIHIIDKTFEVQRFAQLTSRTNQNFPRYS